MDYPKISIVTPNFNGAAYLEETILSVVSQNYPNLEYIIIDGGSTDNSVEIIKKYENQLALWISEPDKGMYHAIQKGFDRSTGEIMAWINSDDMYHRNALFTVSEIFSSFEEVRWLVGASTVYDEYNRTVSVEQSRHFTKFDIYNYDYKWIQQESIFWRRFLWDDAGSTFDKSLKYAGDFALWLKYFSSEKLYVTNALIGGFRFRKENQITLNHLDDYFKEVESLLSRVELNTNEKKILRRYKKLLAVEKTIKKLKLLRRDWFILHFREKYFQPPKRIEFDRYSMKFVLIG